MYADHSCWFLACGPLCILFLACVIQYWVPPILIQILAESWWPLSVAGVLQGSMLIIKQRLSQITVIHLPDCKFQFASNVLYRVSVRWFRRLLHPRDTCCWRKTVTILALWGDVKGYSRNAAFEMAEVYYQNVHILRSSRLCF